MPKKKTKKLAAKRLKISARGKVMFTRPGRGHLLAGKSRKQKRRLRHGGSLGKADHARITELLV